MMKKLMVTVVVALLAVPAVVSAQSQVTATATVAQVADLSGTGDVVFGTVSSSTNNVVSAAGGAGSAQRSLAFNHNIRVTFTSVPSALTGPGGSLAVSLMCANQVATVWSTPEPCSSATFDLNISGGPSTAELGFGGEILATDVANAAAGSYSGTFDIVVVAN